MNVWILNVSLFYFVIFIAVVADWTSTHTSALCMLTYISRLKEPSYLWLYSWNPWYNNFGCPKGDKNPPPSPSNPKEFISETYFGFYKEPLWNVSDRRILKLQSLPKHFPSEGSYIVKWQGCSSHLLGLKFQVLVSLRGCLFATSLKHMVVLSRVPNVHNFIER